ncbi:MAG: hypothetical protein GY711_15925 [bacterium]|nr:hypothetical protein [bacterium]
MIRGESARNLLKMHWSYPVYTPPVEKDAKGSVAVRKRQALSREAAIAYIAGDDPRPLLVLRECKVCNGTDDALLKGGVDNEKTFLLSRWFHCVKLPADVLEKDHPFHALFTQEKPEHLFVCSIDGTNHNALESDTSRTKLWKSLHGLLAREYLSKPDKPLKRAAKLLDQMDVVDRRLDELTQRRDDLLEKDGPDSRKLPKLAKKIAKAEAERDELRADIVKATALKLKPREEEEAK